MKLRFDSGEKLCGVGNVSVLPWYMPALKISYALTALIDTKGKVLDIGCGAGSLTYALQSYRPDLDFTGCDINKKELFVAKKAYKDIRFVSADTYKLPFPSRSFDAVVSFDLLEHIVYLQKAIHEMKRILKKGGVVHLALPIEGSLGNLEGWLTKLGWRAKKVTCGHYPYGIKQVQDILKAEGFQIEKVQYSEHLFHQVIDALYFSWLYARGEDVQFQIEGYAASGKGPLRGIIWFLKNIFATCSYIESKLFFFLPGLHVHVTATKI